MSKNILSLKFRGTLYFVLICQSLPHSTADFTKTRPIFVNEMLAIFHCPNNVGLNIKIENHFLDSEIQRWSIEGSLPQCDIVGCVNFAISILVSLCKSYASDKTPMRRYVGILRVMNSCMYSKRIN